MHVEPTVTFMWSLGPTGEFKSYDHSVLPPRRLLREIPPQQSDVPLCSADSRRCVGPSGAEPAECEPALNSFFFPDAKDTTRAELS